MMEADDVRRAFAGLREALEAYLPERPSVDEVIDRVVPWEEPPCCPHCGKPTPVEECRRVAPGDALWITDREGGTLHRVVVQGVTFYRPAGSGIDSIILRVSEQ
jgi:hypothetical protein